MQTAQQQWTPSAYSLFLQGKDTSEIAKALRISEARALKALSVERSRSKELPQPYGARP
jgi:hypothetical protein